MANPNIEVEITFEADHMVTGAQWVRFIIKGRPSWKWRKWIPPQEADK